MNIKPWLGLSAVIASTLLAACNDGTSGGLGDQPDPEQPEQPQSLRTLDCEVKAKLINVCNFQVVHDANVAANKKDDLFAPTAECKTELANLFLVDPSWKKAGEKNVEARETMLLALHTLFFTPLAIAADQSFIWAALPEKVNFGQMAKVGALSLNEQHDYLINHKSANDGLIDDFYGEITKIVLSDYEGVANAPHMDTYSSLLTVNRYYLTGELNVADAGRKYIFARSLYHEYRHATGQAQHTGCDRYFGSEVECDDNLQQSAYGSDAQFAQAMVLGAIYGRLENTTERVQSTTVLTSVFKNNCTHTLEKVNDVGAWVKENDLAADCSTSTFVDKQLSQRKYGSGSAAGGPAPTDGTSEAWRCVANGP